MQIYKGYKFRIYPNDNQKTLINSWLGSTRFVYNHFLDISKNYYEEKKLYLGASAMKKQLLSLEEQYLFLKEVDSMALRKSIDNLDRAYKNFFAGRSNYPKFKSKGVYDTCTTTCVRGRYQDKQSENIKIDLNKRKIILPKLKNIPFV